VLVFESVCAFLLVKVDETFTLLPPGRPGVELKRRSARRGANFADSALRGA
jgi:hypothetical protein